MNSEILGMLVLAVIMCCIVLFTSVIEEEEHVMPRGRGRKGSRKGTGGAPKKKEGKVKKGKRKEVKGEDNGALVWPEPNAELITAIN